jgi:hypothetical protein
LTGIISIAVTLLRTEPLVMNFHVEASKMFLHMVLSGEALPAFSAAFRSWTVDIFNFVCGLVVPGKISLAAEGFGGYPLFIETVFVSAENTLA